MEITRVSELSGITRTFDLDLTFEQIYQVECAGKPITQIMNNLSEEEQMFFATGICSEDLENDY